MTSALKRGGEELFQNAGGHMVGNETTGHHQDVGIVVLTAQFGNLCIPAEGSANALVLVERHGNAVSAAADGDAWIAFTSLYGLCQGVGKVGVVAAFGSVRAEVFLFITILF